MQIKRGGGGFTLAELLIVMAIIVALAAVAIPTFGRQLETARETGDMELIRSAYTDALAIAVLDASDGTLDGKNGSKDFTQANTFAKMVVAKVEAATASGDDPAVTGGVKVKVTIDALKQSQTGWQYINASVGGLEVTAVGNGTSTPATGNDRAEFKFVLDNEGSVSLESVELSTDA